MLATYSEACLALKEELVISFWLFGSRLGWVGSQLLPSHSFPHFSGLIINSPVKSAEKEVGPFRKDPVVWGTFKF